jgi:putative membrane-bound dehydrogenase-like protein
MSSVRVSARWTAVVFSFGIGICALPAVHPARGEQPLPQVERLKSSPVLRHLRPNPSAATAQSPAAETLAAMYLPEGFQAVLVAAEPDVRQPIAFAFDERGRIWVAEAYSYPTRRPPGEGLDKIVILEDRDGDGTFESRKVFAEGLNLVSGFEVGYGGVWIGAAPELLFIPDRNRDDVPDAAPQVLLDGFGYQDTHECLNSFLWGPDGWLYGNQGVFNTAHIGKPGASDAERTELRAGVWRYHPVRHEFEVFAHGGSNQWGLDYDEHGQIFMTHCRSYWGRGCTTHVVQGGHYWNQANANYAPFIIGNPPREFPEFRNYLLASARYDHGAGGAGVRGSDAVYGGHSHVGTMIYLGDNWPDEFRGKLFTHNLHGHQINQQVNRRLGSGFDTVHAGKDQFFCSDPKYVAVDLQYGPDGAVYIIDWYDQQHCHNPNTERWDRGNGRIYRVEYTSSYKPLKVDLASLDDAKLVELQTHKNDWYARTARRLLHERSTARPIAAEARSALLELKGQYGNPPISLRALWTLHAIGALTDELARQTLNSPPEIRAWAIRLATEGRDASPTLQQEFVRLARADPAPVVRLHLASAIQRVPEQTAWELIEALAQQPKDRDDRNIPGMIWFGLAQRMKGDTATAALDRALAIAQTTPIPQLADSIYWYAAIASGDGLNRVISGLSGLQGEALQRRLAGIELAVASRGRVEMPAAWKTVAPQLYASETTAVQRNAERLAAAFGDESMFPRLRQLLDDAKTEKSLRQHAFAVLGQARDAGSLSVFLRLLDDEPFRIPTINLLSRFDSVEIPGALISRFEKMSQPERSAALNALTSRASFALALLDAVAAGRVKRDQLTAFHIRQLTSLKNAEVDQRVEKNWGKVRQSPAEKQALIARLEKVYAEAPLWAYDARAGRQHFQKLCSQCHKLQNEGTAIGPDLTGAGKNGIRYYLENLIDPNAVIGTDFQMTQILTQNGTVITGLITNETPAALTLRTVMGETIVPKSDIAERATSDKSLMPEGQLESLNDRERLELLKLLMTN